MTVRFWPYEEVEFVLTNAQAGSFAVRCPWVESEIEVEAGSQNFQTLAAYALGGLDALQKRPGGMVLLSQILQALSSLPIAYQLPRKEISFGNDEHRLSASLDLQSPEVLARSLGIDALEGLAVEWSWDVDAMLELARVAHVSEDRFDPLTLLTAARRFHYLDCADNEMAKVYGALARVENPALKKQASALIVRQNHYVTEKCESSLLPAFELAQSARAHVEEFVQAERGHDLLLAGSLRALGTTPEALAPVPAVQRLMDSLKGSASTNFLAFCLALDFFEKPQFRDEDELGETLTRQGHAEAARALQVHKDINDEGEHEAVSQELLETMKPVTADYARQALRLAELVSSSISQVPHDLRKKIPDASAY
jgi:hypothetical protein